MHVLAHFVDTDYQPAPVIPSDRTRGSVYSALIGTVPLCRGNLTSLEITFPPPGGCELSAPLQISVGGRMIDNPGLAGLFDGARLTVWRNGASKVFDGFIDSFDFDWSTGWANLKGIDGFDHVNRTNHGVGTGTGWVGGTPPDPDDPEDTLPSSTGGWAPYNANVTAVTTPWGPGMSVTHGDIQPQTITTDGVTRQTADWSFGYLSFVLPAAPASDEDESRWTSTSSANARIEAEMIVKLGAKTTKVGVITCKVRNLSNPKRIIDVPVSIGDPARGRWSKPISLSTIEADASGSKLIDVAGWAEPGSGNANQFALRYKIVTPTSPDDPTTTVKVPTGGSDLDFVTVCATAAFAQAGVPYTASQTGVGLVFSEGVILDDADTGTYGGHMGTYSTSVEWRWRVDRLEVAPTGDLGITWKIVAHNLPGGRLTKLSGSSSRRASRVTTTASGDDGQTYRYTFDDGGGAPRWDRIASIPQGAPMGPFSQLLADAAARPDRTATFTVGPPPGAASPGDWLDLGLTAGDRVLARVNGLPGAEIVEPRITSLRLTPGSGDQLEITVAAIP